MITVTATTACAAWCANHDGFDDGSDDWHRSQDVDVHSFIFHTSTGPFSGEAEVFMPQCGAPDGMSLSQAEEFANGHLGLVKAARA